MNMKKYVVGATLVFAFVTPRTCRAILCRLRPGE